MTEKIEAEDTSERESSADQWAEQIASRDAGRSNTEMWRSFSQPDSFLGYYSYVKVEMPFGLKIHAKYHDQMTVQELLQQIADKAGVNPDDHYITYNFHELNKKKTCGQVDMVPNSLLKLFKCPKESIILDVSVTIQVKDIRFCAMFKPSDNIWHCLTVLCAHDTFDENLVPVLIYMKQEFIGEEVMKGIRLRDLGINGGSCFLRFLQLHQEDLDQRKLKDDNISQGTLESLELIAAGITTDAGVRNIRFSPNAEEMPSGFIVIGGRNTVIYKTIEGFSQTEELLNEFFDCTIEEIERLFKDLQKNTQIQRDAPVIRRAARVELLKRKAKKSSFDETIIRILFPDDYVIQAIFANEETIADVKMYLKSYLLDSNEHYVLYSNPPKVIHTDGQTMGELKKVPTGIFYFENHNSANGQYLKSDISKYISTYENACEAALALRGKSLLYFMNYYNKYGDNFIGKVMGFWPVFKDFVQRNICCVKDLEKEHGPYPYFYGLESTMNPLVSKWMKPRDSNDSTKHDKENSNETSPSLSQMQMSKSRQVVQYSEGVSYDYTPPSRQSK